MIVGRSEVQTTIADLVAEARRGQGGSLCLVGEAGVGKSALLSWAADAAEGFTVLRTTGVEGDLGELPYGALLDVVGPLRSVLVELPARQRNAMEGALGWGDSSAVSGHLVAGGLVSLLSMAGQRAPVLVVLDDASWIDGESGRILGFAARRVEHDPVVLLLSRRPATPLPPSFVVAETRLPGLDVEAARELLPDVAPSVLTRLVEATAGNPLALQEADGALSPAQRRGSARLPPVLPVGASVRREVEAVLAALSAQARRAVALAAASPDARLGVVAEALRGEALDADAALDEAEGSGLLLTGTSVTFRHPLQRAAAWAVLSPAERRAAHRSLGAVASLDPRLRLRHRVESTTRFDDALSREVERMALEEHDRRRYAESVNLLEAAARLSSRPAHESSLLAAAAEDALVAGDLERASGLAQQTLEASDARTRARALRTLGVVEEYTGSVTTARALLTDAVEAGVGITRIRAAAELAVVGYRLGDAEAMSTAADIIVRHADQDDPEQEMLALYMAGAAAAYSGHWAEAREPTSRALEVLESSEALRDDPRHLVLALSAGVWMGEPERALEFMDRRMGTARAAGALGVLPFALTLLAGGLMLLGRHWQGYAYADEAVRLGRELGCVVDLSTAHELLAWQLAARGRHSEAEDSLGQARGLRDVAGVARNAVQGELVEAYAALCRGDLAVTIRLLENRLERDGGRLPNGDYPLAVAPDLVEAYLGAGRADQAAALASRHGELHLDGASPLPRAHAHRLRAMTAPDVDEAVVSFRAALGEHQRWPDPWEEARTRLQLGALLRRAGRRKEARQELVAAREVFGELGFRTWLDRAEAELAAGGSRARRGADRGQSLTAQEARVVMLVATGMTNREIAESLFLSPKTIEHHVSAALRKTDARSRTELAVAFRSDRGERAPAPQQDGDADEEH